MQQCKENLIEHGTKLKAKSLVISLDAENDFDRTELPYLLGAVSKFDLGGNFIWWMSLLYAAPLCFSYYEWAEVSCD